MDTHGMTIIERDTMYAIQNISDNSNKVLSRKETVALEFARICFEKDFNITDENLEKCFEVAERFLEIGRKA